MPDEHSRDEGPHAGQWALSLGLISLVCSLVPVVGDFISVPVAAAAIIAGLVGIGRHESRRDHTATGAVVGVGLGALSLLLAFLFYLASSGPG